MDIALVTGADAGPGLAIARRLVGMGCRVYALATQFHRNPFPHDDFIPLNCDLADPAALTKAAEDIVAREGHVSFVVHAARRGPVPLLDSPLASLVERVNVGLLAPLALARVTLPWLRKEQGHFLVICWDGTGPAPGGPVTAAVEGGLHHFADALFDELRCDGVRATTLYARANPETTNEAMLSLDPQSAINPELVAETVEHLFRARASNVVSTLVIRPAALAETPRLLRSTELAGITTREIQLPPRENFPAEPEGIPTPTPGRPADAPMPSPDDFADEEDGRRRRLGSRTRTPSLGSLPRWSRHNPPYVTQTGVTAVASAPSKLRDQGGQQGGQRGYDDQGGGRGRGRGRRRGRGGRGGQAAQENQGGRQGNRFPVNQGPKRYPVDARPPQDRPADAGPDRGRDYPDRPDNGPDREPTDDRDSGRNPDFADREPEGGERSPFNRDDSFRTPHPEGDDDSAPQEGDDNGGNPRDEASSDGRDDRGPRDEPSRDEGDFNRGDDQRRDEPRHDDRRDSRHPQDRQDDRGNPRDSQDRQENRDDSRDSADRPAPQHGSHSSGQHNDGQHSGHQGDQRHSGGQQGGPRRHRGFGRRPPAGDNRGGPDRD